MKFAEETSQEVNPSLFKIVITGDTADSTTVRGFAILDEQIFIFTSGSSRIEVYDSISFIFECQKNVKGLDDPFDMASCKLNKCLRFTFCASDSHFGVTLRAL